MTHSGRFDIGHRRCPAELRGRFSMLMFKRSQIYIGFALAALVEIIIRIAVR
jgi:hypothetical protein